MTRIAYVDGRYVRYGEAGVHIEDRGFQFADSVYEVIEVRGGRIVDCTRHLDRLQRNLGELEIPDPLSRPALEHVIRETIRRNRVSAGLVYLQVSRGAAPRDFLYAGATLAPTLVVVARRVDQSRLASQAETGISVVTMPDFRWGRCDIKTVMLLPAVMAKEAARREGAKEAWFLDADGFVTEGASSNAWIVDREGYVVTRPLSRDLLPGVTRATLRDVIAAEGLTMIERPFRLEEARSAREAFNTAATAIVMPVVRIDDREIGDGKPGPLTRRLREAFHRHAEVS